MDFFFQFHIIYENEWKEKEFAECQKTNKQMDLSTSY